MTRSLRENSSGARETGMLPTSGGVVEYLVEGTGKPVTVVGHGLTKSIADTRPMVSDTHGRLAYLHFREHGASHGGTTPTTVANLAEEMRTLADHVNATRGIAVSLSCRVLVSLALAEPARFDRLVLIMPAPLFGDHSLHERRIVMDHFHRAATGDRQGLVAGLADTNPAWTRAVDPQGVFAGAMADELLRKPSLVRSVAELAASDEPFSFDELSSINAPTLVIGQDEDIMHPLPLAQDLAAALPNGQLCLMSDAPSFSAYRRNMRAAVAAFLN